MTGSTGIEYGVNVFTNEISKKQHKKLLKLLFGKIIINVHKVTCDEGFVLEFNDGSTLQVGYAGCEGSTHYNNEYIDVTGAKK